MSEYIQKSIKLQEQEKGLEMGISDKIKKSIHNGILYGDEITRKPLSDLGEYLDQSVLETEKKLKEEYDINTNQWMFSVENLEMLEKIYSLADLIFQDIQHISKYNSIRYLTTWSMLQHLYLTSQEKRLDGKVKQLEIKDNIKLQELREIQEKCLYYCILSNGTYGKGSDLRNIIKVSDFSKDFLTHTKLEETDILYSFWETVPYKPAYVITKDKIRKSIVL